MLSSSRILFLILVVSSTACIVTNLRSLDREIFPSATWSEPRPCKTGVVCDDEDDYPEELVQELLTNNTNLMTDSPNLQQVEDIDNSTENIRVFCESEVVNMTIRKALNVNGKWRYILNNGTQYSFLEICRNSGTPCKYSKYFPSGYIATCEQKFTQRYLLALNKSEVVSELFPLPSCCDCKPYVSEVYRNYQNNHLHKVT